MSEHDGPLSYAMIKEAVESMEKKAGKREWLVFSEKDYVPASFEWHDRLELECYFIAGDCI